MGICAIWHGSLDAVHGDKLAIRPHSKLDSLVQNTIKRDKNPSKKFGVNISNPDKWSMPFGTGQWYCASSREQMQKRRRDKISTLHREHGPDRGNGCRSTSIPPPLLLLTFFDASKHGIV
jgi:hypothetical protein